MHAFSWAKARWQLAGLCPVTLMAIVLGCESATVDPRPFSTSAATEMDMDPSVAELLGLKAERDTVHLFVDRLKTLSKNHGWQQEWANSERLMYHGAEQARAVSIRSGKMPCVVVLLASSTHTIPGSDVQLALLLDTQGRLLDRIACEINSRMTHMDVGRFHVVIAEKPEPDGAQLVFRLDGVSARGNYAHVVTHGEKRANFYWGHNQNREDQPTKWDALGLCRIRVGDGKFQVLFPGEADAE